MTDQCLMVFTTLPDQPVAETIARRLVDAGHAACVTVGAPILSLYHWRGKTETAREVPVTIKTTAGRHAALEALLLELHPYELPEKIATPVTAGHAPYLDWIAAATDRSAEAVNAI